MARDDYKDRKRKRDEEDEQDAQQKAALGLSLGKTGLIPKTGGIQRQVSEDKFEEYMERATPLVDLVANLYNQYFAGAEQRAPIERRQQLDQLMATLQSMSKPTPAQQFRFTSLQSSYITHRDRWDRMIKDLDAGKIKRVAGPRSGPR